MLVSSGCSFVGLYSVLAPLFNDLERVGLEVIFPESPTINPLEGLFTELQHTRPDNVLKSFHLRFDFPRAARYHALGVTFPLQQLADFNPLVSAFQPTRFPSLRSVTLVLRVLWNQTPVSQCSEAEGNAAMLNEVVPFAELGKLFAELGIDFTGSTTATMRRPE